MVSLDPEVPLPMLAMTAQELSPTPGTKTPDHGVVTLLCGSDGIAYRVLEPPEQQPWIEILEQPAPVRFRYGTDGGKSAGTMQGINSTADKRTFPKIRLHGCSGPAYVVVSCVTKDRDRPKAHPHKLVSPFTVSLGQSRNKVVIKLFCAGGQGRLREGCLHSESQQLRHDGGVSAHWNPVRHQERG
jgi:hypothetical protein